MKVHPCQQIHRLRDIFAYIAWKSPFRRFFAHCIQIVDPYGGRTRSNTNVILHCCKVHLIGCLHSVVDNKGLVFIRLAVVASHIYEITRNPEKIRTHITIQSHPRYSTLIGANRKRTCDFLLAITHFHEIMDETYPAKTEGWGENCVILASTVSTEPPMSRQTDVRAIA